MPSLTAPEAVRAELRRGLAWADDGHGGDGLKPETKAWARRLADGAEITRDKAVKMSAWLARHEVDKQGKGFSPGEEGYPSPGRVAWALWGGDPAVGWSAKMVRYFEGDMNKADMTAAERRAAAQSGAAMPDGSFPITDAASLKDAIQSIGRAKDRKRAEAHIKRRARKLGLTADLPDWLTKGEIAKDANPWEPPELPYPLTPEGLTPTMQAAMPDAMKASFIEAFNWMCDFGLDPEDAYDPALGLVCRVGGWCQSRDGSWVRSVWEGLPAETEMEKAGRMFSAKNLAMMKACRKSMGDACDAMDGMIGMGEPSDGEMEKTGSILKTDDEKRLVYAWASVVKTGGKVVTDSQGDRISFDELHKAAQRFTKTARVMKVEHQGPQVGEWVYSMVIDDDVAKSLGMPKNGPRGLLLAGRLDTTPEGEAAWQGIKSGDYNDLSIGGSALRRAAT